MHAKNLALILEILPDRPRFVGSDPDKIGEVVANLVGNAMKYTDHGTVLVRATAKSDAPGVPVICFEVEDTGIADQDQGRILLGGTIHLDSAPRRGSRSRVEIPVQTAEDLAALPGTLKKDLEDAIFSMDQDRVSQVLLRVSQQDRSVGSALESLADNLSYSPILTALRCPEESLRGAT